MIDRQTFAEWMAVFGARYGRSLSNPELRLYYAILSAELDTEGFVAGCTAAFAVAKFWPTCEEIMAGAPATGRAATARNAALQQVLTIVNGYAPQGKGSRHLRERGIAETLGPDVLAAYQAAGGFESFRALQSADDERGSKHSNFPFVRKEFLAALAGLERASVARGALAAATRAGTLQAGDTAVLEGVDIPRLQR